MKFSFWKKKEEGMRMRSDLEAERVKLRRSECECQFNWHPWWKEGNEDDTLETRRK